MFYYKNTDWTPISVSIELDETQKESMKVVDITEEEYEILCKNIVSIPVEKTHEEIIQDTISDLRFKIAKWTATAQEIEKFKLLTL